MADFPIRPHRFLDHLNHEFERLHTAKEDAFWTAHMGLLADAAQATLNEREREFAGFASRFPADALELLDRLISDAPKAVPYELGGVITSM